MRCFVLGFAGFIFAGLIAAVMLPMYADYAGRASLSQTLVSVVPLRTQVGEALVNDPKSVAAIAASASSKPPPGVDYLRIGTDGTIFFRSAKHGQMVLFVPEVVKPGAVTWKCVGGPTKDMPTSCR